MKPLRFFLVMALALFFAAIGRARGDELDFAALNKLIAEHKIKSVDELLTKLLAHDRAAAVLVYNSRSSLQHASMDAPRVILPLSQSKLILAFNGKPGSMGYSLMEVIEFNKARNEFEFHALVFDEKGPSELPTEIKAAPKTRIAESGVHHIPNPALCMKCHVGSKPIWDSYPNWPGVYGTSDDFARFDSSRSEGPEFEQKGLDKFIAAAPKIERYRQLTHTDADYFQRTHINNSFTNKLLKIRFEQISARLRQHPDYIRFRVPLIAAMAGYALEEMQELFPRYMDWDKAQKRHSELYQDVLAKKSRYVQKRLDRVSEIYGVEEPKYNQQPGRQIYLEADSFASTSALALVRLVLEQFKADDVVEWSLTLERETYSLLVGNGSFTEIAYLMVEEAGIDKKMGVHASSVVNTRHLRLRDVLQQAYKADLQSCNNKVTTPRLKD